MGGGGELNISFKMSSSETVSTKCLAFEWRGVGGLGIKLLVTVVSGLEHAKGTFEYELAHDKTYMYNNTDAVVCPWSDQSLLITFAFCSLRAIKRGINENPLPYRWIKHVLL